MVIYIIGTYNEGFHWYWRQTTCSRVVVATCFLHFAEMTRILIQIIQFCGMVLKDFDATVDRLTAVWLQLFYTKSKQLVF